VSAPVVVFALIALAQAVAAIVVAARMARTGRASTRIAPAAAPDGERVVVILPVLNEEARLAPCLDGLRAQGPEVATILVVDGGSSDGTRAVVAAAAAQDPRIQWLEAGPAPAGSNGKANNLAAGETALPADARWVLTIDADVRPRPGLVAAVLAKARAERLDQLSVATSQRLSSAAEGVIHPAMLTTLVYRLGIPGSVATSVRETQANGQCFLIDRAALARVGGFAAVRDSINEDVTLARALVAAGLRSGFYEAGDLVAVEMYTSATDAWRNWSRSLPLRDRYDSGRRGLVEVALAQALPLPLAALAMLWLGPRHPLTQLELALVMMRLGVLVGTARAYPTRPWTYWVSPVADMPVLLRVWFQRQRRRHSWRGRVIERGTTGR
jgi:dolichol-phosphate mannosyltransferase